MIDSSAAQYQDVKARRGQTAMNPASKTSKIGHRKATVDDVENASGYLDGQLLVAMPVMEDERFARSVIYLCAHSSEGAMGIIVNRPAGKAVHDSSFVTSI